ncbi:unnamed protein product [Trichobilharzia szidati]|nr:unnamed protein product [Trichobilharzia szidati]
MRKPDGSPRTPRDPRTKRPPTMDQFGIFVPSKTTVKQITRKWVSAAGTFNKTFPALVTENIIKEAKSHFQCQSVDGVDLENEGSSGSYGSHLEGRVYSMELMAASSEVEAFASRVTLAYFVDSGHESIKPYCDEPNVVACRDLYTYGLCDVYPYPLPLPPADQFFGPEAGRDYNRLGGSNVFKDKCPTLSFLSSLGSLNITSYCKHAENNAKLDKEGNKFLQSFGKAICLQHTGTWRYSQGYSVWTLDGTIKGSCHKYTCKPGGNIDIDFSGQTVTCTKDEKDKTGTFVLDGKKYEVKIRCPNSKVLCKSAARKHFNFKTLDGVDLENEGSLASAGSHFEARIYGDELMVAELQKKSLITPILLAYMNDTGLCYPLKPTNTYCHLFYNPYYNRQQTALEAAIKHWEKALIVLSKTTENILVPRECASGPITLAVRENILYCRRLCKKDIMCRHMRIPDEYLGSCYEQVGSEKIVKYSAGKGLQYNEMLLLVSMRNRDTCGQDVLAWATFCHKDPVSGRPFIGVVNYCYDEETIKSEDIENIIATSKHEIAHALGFHPGIYERLPDLNPEFRLNSNPRPVQKVTRSWLSARGRFNVQKTILRLPNMLNEAKKHFGCNELDGVEVENGHYSQRVLGNEMMTPIRLDENFLSRITLAYFKDTQMYDVDYSAADDFTWGKNLGCEIAMKSCYEYMKTRKAKKESIEPFCDGPQKTKCVDFSNAYGHCMLNKVNRRLPLEFQYADETFEVDREALNYYAGADYMDYCPYYSVSYVS